MLSTIYASAATTPFSDDDLAALLAVSRANNLPRGLTGMLLYNSGQFMQVLEGPDDAVHERLAVIAADVRHSGVWTLHTEQITVRRFPAWTMGFRPVADSELRRVKGYDAFLDSEGYHDDRWAAPDRAKTLLDWFRDHD